MLGIAMISPAAQTDQPPLPKELVQYIREAKKRGEEEGQLKRQAVAAGWSATDVDQAIAKDKTVKSAEPATRPTVVPPQVPPSAPGQLPVALPPATPSVEGPGPDRTLLPTGAPVKRGGSDDYLV